MAKKIFTANKLIIFILSYFGVVSSLFYYGKMDLTKLLFYTAQSNLWIGTNSLFIFLAITFKVRRDRLNILYLLQFVFTVSITMTLIVYCFLLAPFSSGVLDNPWNYPSVFTHVITPLYSIADFLLDRGGIKVKAIHTLYSLIPALIYFATASLLEFFKVDFGYGEPFPYFFMNYLSPARVFGFSRQFPYYFGSFYWYLILFSLGFVISLIYRKIKNKRLNPSNESK